MKEPFWKRPHTEFVASVAAIAFIVSFFFVPDFRTMDFWVGDKGWLEILTLVGTTAAASAAAWFAWRSFIQSQQKDVADRFERGVELLEAGSQAKRIAGIIVLEDLAMLDLGGRHSRWIREFLPVALNEWNALLSSTVSRPLSGEIPPSPNFTLRALRTISTIRDTPPSREYLPNFYLCEASLIDLALPNVVASRSIVSSAAVINCNLDDAVLYASFKGMTEFVNSYARSCRIAVAKGSLCDIAFENCDLSFSRITAQEGAAVTIARCKIDGLVVSGLGEIRLENCWFEEKPPELRNAFAIGGELGIYRSTSKPKSAEGRVPIWQPSESDSYVSKSTVAKGPWIRRGEELERQQNADVL